MAKEDGERTFQDIRADLVYGREDEDEPPIPEDADESEDQDNPEGPEASAPDQEPPEAADKLEEDPDAEAESEPDEEVEAEAEPSGEGEAEPEGDEPEEPEAEVEEAEEPETEEPDLDLPEGVSLKDGQLVAEVDGEEVPVDQLREGYLRRQDYTQKTQRLSEREQQLQAYHQRREELLADIQDHEGMQEFISQHPESVRYFLANPEETRQLMRKPSELEAFAQDYETLMESPRLARKYLEGTEEDGARQELQAERLRRQYAGFAERLDQGVEQIAAHEQFEDAIDEEDVAEVKNYILELGGFDEDSSQEEILQGLNRLANIFVTPDGQNLDMQLVIDRFEAMKAKKQREAEAEEAQAEEHNEQVEAELEEQKERTPKTPSGDGAAPEPETVPERESFGDVLESLRGG